MEINNCRCGSGRIVIDMPSHTIFCEDCGRTVFGHKDDTYEQLIITWNGGKIKANKYNAKKVEIDGIVFDSKGEASRYSELKTMQASGLIKNLTLQPKFTLLEPFTTKKGENIRGISYKADFSYFSCDTGTVIVEEWKGFKTPDFVIRMKLFLSKYPDVEYVIKKQKSFRVNKVKK